MFKKLAEGKVVCVDVTQGTNAYEFKLITLLVVDEHGEGFPVAWCIANREVRVLLIEFFTSIHTQSAPSVVHVRHGRSVPSCQCV